MKKHVEAAAAWEMYCDNKAKDQTVLSQLSMQHADAQRVTREWLKFLSRTLRYCASQEIALRAHRDDGENKGNFMGAVSLVLRHSQELRDLETKIPQNASYLSHDCIV